ncbi:hypothetical protein [Rhodopseudomonas palustris]|uniref:hypothetical protein n=1 Tax=Rhodopseudomonas palustris TaxID=1076 RepID=UPI0010579254|nr:hypothetical protein [Rhodopseudomonas palustris]
MYDDNGYLLDAFKRIAFNHVWSLRTLIADFINNPPHAPVETLTAMIGFWLFGPHNAGPYIANYWGLLAYAAMMFTVASAWIEARPALLIAVAAMFVPAAGAIITELRPDMIAGLFFAFAGYLLLVSEMKPQSIKFALVIGLVCAFAVTIKLSAAVLTIPMIGLAAIARFFLAGKSWKKETTNLLVMLISAATVVVPVSIVWGPQTYAYIYQTLVTNKDIWHTPGGWLFHIGYNLTGTGGYAALGYSLFIGMALIVSDLIYSLVKRDLPKRVVSYYLWTTLIFVGLIFTADKSVYQSSFFFFPFIVSSVLACARLIGRFPKYSMYASVIVVGTVSFSVSPAHTYQQGIWRNQTAPMLQQIVSIVKTNALGRDNCLGTKYVYATIGAYPVTAEAVALSVAQKYNMDLSLQHLFMARSLDSITASLKHANFVLLPNGAGTTESRNQHLPGIEFYDQVKVWLRGDPAWTEHQIEAADPPTLFVRTSCSTAAQ